ncbi:MAG: DUF1638 domain-containing protein [Planctomycetes bacterium]|nr:DUF1638 domain-containing protein [Planctomycetota bacterium]
MKRFQFIACKVLQREAYLCAARSKNNIDIVFMEQGLHNQPDDLRRQVQDVINRTHDKCSNKYDASLLGYGLCSNGIAGLSAQIPIVVPRGHDCVTLLLGSKDKYKEYFEAHRGVYWYSSGWISTGTMPSKERYEKNLAEYKEKYGDDNAEYLMQVEQDWIKEYNWAAYIDWDLATSQNDKKYTKACADYLGWKYDEIKGDPALIQKLLDGQWDDKDFLIVNPGQKIVEDLTTENIIKAE